jgi:hypothetical protein
MRVTQQQKQLFADQLCVLVMRTFFHAYFMHKHGMTEEELLIDYDIKAAGFNIDEHVAHTCRTTIKSAVQAVDQGVPYATACQYLRTPLRVRIDQLFKKKRLARSFVRDSICHAMGHD